MRNSRFRRPMMREKAAGGQRQWFTIKNLGQNGVAEIYLYDEIGWYGITASDFVAALQQVNATQLDVHLNSPGGDVYDGIAIYQALVSHPANVTMYVDSLAASAASFIAMAGDEIEISPFGTMMIHDAHGLCIGNAADMTAFAANLDAASQNIANVYATRTGDDAATWRQAMQDETWYYGEQAVAAGLADRVGPAKDGTDAEGVDQAIAAKWDLTIFSHTPERLIAKVASTEPEGIPLPPVRNRKRVTAPVAATEAPNDDAPVEAPTEPEEAPEAVVPPIVTDSDTGDDAENDARVTSDLTAGSDDSGTVKDTAQVAPTVPEVEVEPALDFESIRAAMRGAYKNG